MTGFYPEPQEHQDNEIFKPKFVFVKFNDERVENITNFNPLESLGIIFQHPYLKLNLRFVLKYILKNNKKIPVSFMSGLDSHNTQKARQNGRWACSFLKRGISCWAILYCHK